MAFLKEFTATERGLLASLPYRVGLWVSVSDATGGVDSGQQERVALEKTITGIAQGMFESAFVHEIFAETFLLRHEWDKWAHDIATVPEDCVAAVRLLQGRLSARDIDAYRHILMQIGLEVARAFREYDSNEPFLSRIVRGISIVVDRIFGVMHGEKYVSDDLLNISYDEDVALNALAKALRGETGSVSERNQILSNS